MHSDFSYFETIITDFESLAADLLVCVTHPGRHGLSHALLEGETESAVTLETTLLSQLLGSEGTIGSYRLTIETDEMIDAQIVDISIVTYALTGEIAAEIETIKTKRLGQLENS